jgi:hypothetical protein
MSSDSNQPQAWQPINLDDEIAALTFQLEEIGNSSSPALQKGKHRADEPPDRLVALSNFRAELEATLTFFQDRKLAQSISQAIDTDALAIARATREERQSVQDRRIALQLSGQVDHRGVTLPGEERDDHHTQPRLAMRLMSRLKPTFLTRSRDQVCPFFVSHKATDRSRRKLDRRQPPSSKGYSNQEAILVHSLIAPLVARRVPSTMQSMRHAETHTAAIA